jgi:hypothetical protein
MMKAFAVMLLSILILFVSGCVTEPDLDKGKFADLGRAAQDLKAAIDSNAICQAPDTLQERFSTGIAALKDRTVSTEERALLAAYAHLAETSRDGRLLCRYRTHLTKFPFVPKGRIYVTQELDPIVEKYDLPTEKHLYEPTETHWRSISDTSITAIWEHAREEIRNIETMVKYN